MINIVKNEIYKIFHKKSTFIILIILIGFVLLTSIIYNSDSYDYYYSNLEYLEQTLKELENNNGLIEDKIYYSTEIAVEKLLLEYEKNSWQKDVIIKNYYDVANRYYHNYYNNLDTTEIEKEMQEFKKLLDNNNWKEFVINDLNKIKDNLKDYENSLNSISYQEKSSIEEQIKILKNKIRLLNYRLENNVVLGNNYLSMAIDQNSEYLYHDVLAYEKSHEKELESLENAVKTYYENEYILKEKVDINNSKSLYAILVNFFSEYEFLMFVFLIMIAGSIVSEEFSKGTIKSILTIPHSRNKILMGKYLSVLLMIPFIFIFLIIGEIVIGGLILGFDSLTYPVISYNIATASINELSLFTYLVLLFITKLPKLVLLATLAFSISTILTSTSFALAITFCGYLGAEIINAFALNYNLKFLDYFVTTNWDLSAFIFNNKTIFENSLSHSIIICIIYLIIMLVISLIVFKKRNIKNI
ncbi:MAG: hypothetical protein E7172_05655 [Firmicutes bacterium]|nr:hypothetical protein [Bacillota bacterium]